MNLQSNHLARHPCPRSAKISTLSGKKARRDEKIEIAEGKIHPFVNKDIVIICKCAGAVAYEEAD
jgi:hypothetical protein